MNFFGYTELFVNGRYMTFKMASYALFLGLPISDKMPPHHTAPSWPFKVITVFLFNQTLAVVSQEPESKVWFFEINKDETVAVWPSKI